MKIWIDDVRIAPEGYTWCKSVNQAISVIEELENKNINIELIHLDHDAGDYAEGAAYSKQCQAEREFSEVLYKEQRYRDEHYR